MVRKNNWAEDRVFFFDDDGQLTSIPAGFTDIDAPDPFVAFAAGRSALRVDDLLALADLTEGIAPGEGSPRCKANYAAFVKPISPTDGPGLLHTGAIWHGWLLDSGAI